ncbi:fimbrillin family protein [Parabacteroides pacaensis]|uniref:fimbrillin family protein n=1 Tax=Parabacteroides pacaensis TaxID=2086575 RepID=UPI000D0F9DD6|nr:fimbrillin family protein [Parabacteroides pacaensis]
MKAKYLLIATAATLLAACSNDENVTDNGPVEARVTAGFGAMSRAVNTDDTWARNDEIGVMVTKVEQSGGSGTTSGMVDRYKNVKYITEQGGGTATFKAAEAGQGIFFQDATETVTFAAYYPYQTSTDASTLPGAITVNTKDNNTDAKQAKIDFLFATGATASKSSPAVEFKDNSATPGATNCQFLHKMAQLKLVIVGSTADGFTEEEAKAVCAGASTYKLGGLKHEGAFTLEVSSGTATGTAASTGTADGDWNITGCMKKDEESAYKRTYTLVLLPQDCSSSALTFQATIGGQTYKNTTDITPNLKAGNTYTYTITAKKKGLEVSGCTIKAWTSNDDKSGDATM